MLTVNWWRSRLYPDRERQNPARHLMRLIETRLQPHHRILDIGAGAGERNAYESAREQR